MGAAVPRARSRLRRASRRGTTGAEVLVSEPSRAAQRVEALRPSLLHWTVQDDRIGARSEAYAILRRGRSVLVDPLPLAPRALAALGRVTAVVLTIQSHQRSAWRYRRRFGVEVHAPRGAEGLEEDPDRWYEDGAELPGGLTALHAPGPCEASYALHAPRLAGGVLFVGDLVIRGDDGPFGFVPDEYQDAPRRTRASVRALARLRVAIVCSGHGAPVLEDGAAALRAALRAR
jgi:glyoxylase-like metal-dependent hydrolase (beta-lactamase superfamily II)